MAIYRHENDRALVEIPTEVRLSNQVVFSGTNDKLIIPNGIFFLEYLEPDKLGSVTLKDGAGNTICSGLSAFENDYSPLRCDGGIEIVGDVVMAKGFVLPGVFA